MNKLFNKRKNVEKENSIENKTMNFKIEFQQKKNKWEK